MVIPGAGHFFHGHLLGLKGIVTDFLLARYNSARYNAE
jgi:alpha/beta superfamily hydrolase